MWPCLCLVRIDANEYDRQNTSGNRSGASSPVNQTMPRRNTARSRAGSLTQRFAGIAEDEFLEPPQRPGISNRLPSGQNSPRRELPGFDLPVRPPIHSRTNSAFEGPTSLARDGSPAGMPRLTRVPTEPGVIQGARGALRVTKRDDVFGDEQSDYGDGRDGGMPVVSRTTSWSRETGMEGIGGRKGPPPPPPPSRSKKPPPPPPLKRSALSTSEVPGYY